MILKDVLYIFILVVFDSHAIPYGNTPCAPGYITCTPSCSPPCDGSCVEQCYEQYHYCTRFDSFQTRITMNKLPMKIEFYGDSDCSSVRGSWSVNTLPFQLSHYSKKVGQQVSTLPSGTDVDSTSYGDDTWYCKRYYKRITGGTRSGPSCPPPEDDSP